MDRLKAWFHAEIAEDNERLRWIQNDKLPPRLELRDYFHAFETDLNRNEMIGYVLGTLHMLHITDIISPQYQQSLFKRRRPRGEATMRDVAPNMEHLPVKFVQLLTSLREKTNKSMPPSMSLPESFTAQELRDGPTDAGVPDDDDEEGNPWDALDVNEYEGPSVGKAKANHAAPPDPSAKAPPAEPESPTAASTGAPPERMSSVARSVQSMPKAMWKSTGSCLTRTSTRRWLSIVLWMFILMKSSPKQAGRWMVLTS